MTFLVSHGQMMLRDSIRRVGLLTRSGGTRGFLTGSENRGMVYTLG